MINPVSKNHIQLRSIERGVANLPLCLAAPWLAQLVAVAAAVGIYIGADERQ